MSNKKLHPIYVALDAHQYSRAVKLAAALPDSNVLGKALLAHSLFKSGQKYQALVTLHKILGDFCELKYQVSHALEAFQEQQAQQSSKQSAPTEPAPSTSSKKGKKGKKKPAPAPKQQAPKANDTNKNLPTEDLVTQLTSPPSLPENWEFPPTDRKAITDETTLATLSVTLQNLKLSLTAYQMYALAAKTEPTETILTKAFSLGLTVMAAPSKWTKESQTKISVVILANLQAIALQWARYSVSQQSTSSFSTMLATAWAAQTALWQLEWLPEDQQRSLILPRLAESMAKKLSKQEEESPSAEIQLLCLRTLEKQSKWSDMLDLLEKLPVPNGGGEQSQPPTISSEFGVALTTHQILTEKARMLLNLEQYESAREVFAMLLVSSPDDWSCWKGYLDASIKDDKIDLAKSLVEKTLSDRADSKYPLRGPHLMKVEISGHLVRNDATDESIKALGSAIMEYADLFAPRAACAFSDLENYVELLAASQVAATEGVIGMILEKLDTMRKESASSAQADDVGNKERQSKLRTYIFTTKLNHKLLAARPAFVDRWIPNWVELVTEWKATLSLSSSNEGEETQKELKPGDELLLLAVQQLLYQNSEDVGAKVVCAALLEEGINHSPDNAYMKVAAIDVYHQLNAMSRSWTFFQAMSIKHIQLDSCIFPILPFLMEGGMYSEAIELCNALLRFQISTARDCGDYAGRAMEAGTLSKANEFLIFQRNKMNKSLTAIEAKGIILDSAPLIATAVPRKKHDEDPLLKGGLGMLQGIVGGTSDVERATQMISEVHNPFAALNVVSWANNGGSIEDVGTFSDNRDLSILCHQFLYRTKVLTREEIVRSSLRRGHMHGLLIRAALCLDSAKGPKKGKVVKPSEELEKRALSLLDTVNITTDFAKKDAQKDGGACSEKLVDAILNLCKALSMINAGLPLSGNDSLERREEEAVRLLQNEVLVPLNDAKACLRLDVKDVCSMLPNYMVPLFAVFRMCASICETYGWGKRKRYTKRCAGALANCAGAINGIVEEMLSCLKQLPSEETSTMDIEIQKEQKELLDAKILEDTTDLLVQCQYRTRFRVEPVLQEMDEYLDTFNVAEN